MSNSNLPSTWLLWQDGAHDPYLNMSIDELLLQEFGAQDKILLRLYSWDRPSVSIGYVQDYTAAPYETYSVVRRPTGGGIVYHDHDLTYTLIVPKDHEFCQLDRVESYHIFHRSITNALGKLKINATLSNHEALVKDRARMVCFTTPTKFDVINADGEKYAGAAQRRTKNGILHQGSIDLKAADNNAELLRSALLEAFAADFNISYQTFELQDAFLQQAEKLADEKYATGNWNQHKTHTH